MAINMIKVERVAGIVAQELRNLLAAERAKLPEGKRHEWPLFFHPIDVAHDWFFESQGKRAFGRLSGREQDLVARRLRDLLAPECAEYKACREREREEAERQYREWEAQAGAEMAAWRAAAEGSHG